MTSPRPFQTVTSVSSPAAVYVHAVLAGALNLESRIRSIDFEAVFVIEMADAEDERALGQAQLGGPVVKLEKGDAGFRIHAHGSGADLELGAGILVRPEIVPVAERTILDRGYPVALAAGLKRNGTVGIAEPGDAAGRVLGGRGIGLRRSLVGWVTV